MADENQQPPQNDKDAEYWKAEAKRAFEDGDAAKRKAKELEARALSDDDAQLFATLKEQQAKAEEDRAKKAGEFETLRTNLVKKHDAEIATRDQAIATLTGRFRDTVVRAEFGAAGDLFGGHDQSKTILDTDLALAALGKYVHVEDDAQDPRGYRVVVKSPRGDTIVGTDGHPAHFSEAMAELITQLPNKDRILRGSGKTGSGSSGGSTGTTATLDVRELTTRAQAGDKEALRLLAERQRSKGQMVVGPAFQRQAS